MVDITLRGISQHGSRHVRAHGDAILYALVGHFMKTKIFRDQGSQANVDLWAQLRLAGRIWEGAQAGNGLQHCDPRRRQELEFGCAVQLNFDAQDWVSRNSSTSTINQYRQRIHDQQYGRQERVRPSYDCTEDNKTS